MFASKLILLSGLISFLLLVILSSLSLNWWELVIFVVVATSGYGISFGFKWGQRGMRLRAFVGVILIAFSLIITFSDGSVVWPFKSHKLLTAALLSTILLIAVAYLAKMALRAPMDGVMGTREVEEGEYFTPQSPPMTVGTLMEMEAVFVELGIIERDIERIRMGQRVKVTVDSLPNTTFDGTIDNLAPLIEGKSRTLTAKVKVENPRGQLLPGMFARAEVAVFEKPDALVIPTSALKDADGDGTFESVFVLQGEKAASKAITLGYLTTDYAEIAAGLEEGEQVITEARGELKDGSAVTLLEEEESAIERAEPEVPGSKKE